jgi:hypothetical protein
MRRTASSIGKHNLSFIIQSEAKWRTWMNPWRLFTKHPASVGETYLQHLRAACTFGLCMLVGGAVCLLHAVLPFLCIRTASDCVAELHDRMSARRQPSYRNVFRKSRV